MVKIIFVFLLVIISFSFVAKSQDTNDLREGQVIKRVVSDKTYNEVLDIVFPREIKRKRETVWQIVLRFKSFSSSESQIVLRKTVDGYEVEEFTSQNGLIFPKLNDWFTKNESEDVKEMVKLIEVSKREIKVMPREIDRWYNIFFQSIPSTSEYLKFSSQEFDRTKSFTVLLHGTYYELWFHYKGNELNFTIYDQEISNSEITGRYALVKWMNKIRLSVDKR